MLKGFFEIPFLILVLPCLHNFAKFCLEDVSFRNVSKKIEKNFKVNKQFQRQKDSKSKGPKLANKSKVEKHLSNNPKSKINFKVRQSQKQKQSRTEQNDRSHKQIAFFKKCCWLQIFRYGRRMGPLWGVAWSPMGPYGAPGVPIFQFFR